MAHGYAQMRSQGFTSAEMLLLSKQRAERARKAAVILPKSQKPPPAKAKVSGAALMERGSAASVMERHSFVEIDRYKSRAMFVVAATLIRRRFVLLAQQAVVKMVHGLVQTARMDRIPAEV